MYRSHISVVITVLFLIGIGHNIPGVVLAKTDPSSLGQGFYLPEKDILGKFYDGASIFDTIEKRCVKVAKTRDTDRQNRYFKSNENFYKYLSSKTGIDGQYKGSFTMKTTLDITTKSISDSTHQVSLYMLDIYALKDTMFFAKNCQNTLPFSKAFLADFHKLPVQIKDINRKDYWLPYESFLKKYGSHIVNEINRGSRLRQWMFASSTEKYTERDFNVRACLELSKNTDSLGVKACSGITSKEKKSVEKMTMRNARHLRGGKPKTTAKLAEKGSPELIEKFLVEAQKSPGDVLYKFTAIWDLLQERYLGSNDDDLARSLNLEACYSAVLDLKCTRPSDDKVSLKWLEPDKKSKLPTFSCKIAALGCQKDSDCHIGGAASVCYCYGSSCVDKKEKNDPNSRTDARVIRRRESGSYYEGVNDSCYYHAGVYCKCDTEYASPVKIWGSKLESEFRRFSFPLHSKMTHIKRKLKKPKCYE